MAKKEIVKPKCNDKRQCFAKERGRDGYYCTILAMPYTNAPMYADGDCPFCKPEKEVTNGKYYPYDTNYGSYT